MALREFVELAGNAAEIAGAALELDGRWPWRRAADYTESVTASIKAN
jgi:hypothetical protein